VSVEHYYCFVDTNRTCVRCCLFPSRGGDDSHVARTVVIVWKETMLAVEKFWRVVRDCRQEVRLREFQSNRQFRWRDRASVGRSVLADATATTTQQRRAETPLTRAVVERRRMIDVQRLCSECEDNCVVSLQWFPDCFVCSTAMAVSYEDTMIFHVVNQHLPCAFSSVLMNWWHSWWQ